MRSINFFEFRRLQKIGEVDGLIIASFHNSIFAVELLKHCKLNGIKKVAVVGKPSNNYELYWTDEGKIYIPYIETNLIDGCNLSCKGCTHFANLFSVKEICPLETFKRDMRKISEVADLTEIHLIGGEPLLLKNLDDYIEVARHFLPKSRIEVGTNALLIPNTAQKIFDSIRNNNIVLNISGYPPTMKNFDKIKSILDANKISYMINRVVKDFSANMSTNSNHDPAKSVAACSSKLCRFLRDGKIYKCPIDGFSFRLAEKFKIKNIPAPTYADLFAPNFAFMFYKLNEAVEMCYWCAEQSRQFDWEQSTNPKLSDWLANPEEVNNFEHYLDYEEEKTSLPRGRL